MRFIFSLLVFVFLGAPLWAAEPVAIEAGGTLEWLRDQHMYKATKNIVITQGSTTIMGDSADAAYDPEKGPSSLTRISVTGHVRMTEGDTVITADTAIYDVLAHSIQLRGDNVSITSAHGTVTADEIDYNMATREAVGRGHASVTQHVDGTTRTLEAKTIHAWFSDTNALTRAAASGGVLLRQQRARGVDVITAADGLYDAEKSIITLNGGVKMIQGQNRMEGDTATVNLATGQSRLSSNGARDASGNATSRVRAVFTPGDNNPLPRVNADIPMVPAKKTTEDPYATQRGQF
jgi:lipopolysaccharide export system protein LptA